MANIDLKVAPEQIAELAGQIADIYSTVSEALKNIETEKQQMQADWEGETKELYAGTSGDLTKQSEQIPLILKGYINTMNDLSGIYVQAESTVKNLNQALPTDGVFL